MPPRLEAGWENRRTLNVGGGAVGGLLRGRNGGYWLLSVCCCRGGCRHLGRRGLDRVCRKDDTTHFGAAKQIRLRVIGRGRQLERRRQVLAYAAGPPGRRVHPLIQSIVDTPPLRLVFDD